MKFLKLGILFLIINSCTSEKVTLSPMYDGIESLPNRNSKNFIQTYRDKTGEIFYASELISSISSFPKFKNSALNNEVSILKMNIKEYVYAVKNYNLLEQERYMNKIEKSYRKIQGLRKHLNASDDDVINHYLVKIKSNLYQLKSINKDSIK